MAIKNVTYMLIFILTWVYNKFYYEVLGIKPVQFHIFIELFKNIQSGKIKKSLDKCQFQKMGTKLFSQQDKFVISLQSWLDWEVNITIFFNVIKTATSPENKF